MNRAILVIMCDFIVVSMLSMITGLSTLENPYGDDGAVVNSRTANVIIEQLRSERLRLAEAIKELQNSQEKFGYSQAREAAMKKIEVQMAKTEMQLEMLQTKDLTALDVSEKTIQKIDQANLNSRYQQALNELNNVQNKNKLDTFNFGAMGSGKGSGGGGDSSAKVVGYTSNQDAMVGSEEVKIMKDLLSKREVDLEHTMNELTETEERLKALDQEKTRLNERINTYKENVEKMEQELTQAEDKLINSQKQLVVTRKQITQKEQEIVEHKKQIDSTRNVLKRAVTDLSVAQKEVTEKTREILEVKKASIELQTQLEKEIAEAEKSLQHMKKSLSSDVLITYQETIKNLRVINEQKRLFFDYKNGGNYYLPVIKIQGKPVIISLFRLLSGNSLDKAEFEDVTKLDYQLLDPNGDGKSSLEITGPLFISRKDIRVALLEIPEAPKETLHFLSVSDVRGRGFHDLYLFKNNQFGKDGGTLEGRCSMSLSKNDDYLYIRNNSESTTAAVAAEVGDMVMTREGGFVGIVVQITKLDNGKEEAKCFIFPDDFELRNSIKLSIKKERNQEFYTDFTKLGAKIFERTLKLEGR